MGIFDFWRKADEVNPQSAYSGQPFDISSVESSQELAEYLRAGFVTESGEVVGLRESLSVASVYRCVNILCGVIGGMPVEIKNEDTLEVDRKHSLRRLLNRRPNSWQTAHEFKKQLQNSVLLQGNGYARKVWVGGSVTALIPMAAHATSVEQKMDGRLEYTYTDERGRGQVLQQKDIFHVRGMSLDGVRGLSVLSYAREAVGSSRASERHGNKLFKNGTKVGGAFTIDGKLSDEAYTRLKNSLEEFRGTGSERAFRDMILEEGMKYSPFGMTSQDAEFIENRKFSVQEIAMFFGIPPHMIGFTEKATSWGSGIEQQSIGFVNYTLNDWFEAWEGAIERDLLSEQPEMIAEFNTHKLLRGDEKGRWEANRTKLDMGALSADEVRRDEGLPAKPDGSGAKYYEPPGRAVQESQNEPKEIT